DFMSKGSKNYLRYGDGRLGIAYQFNLDADNIIDTYIFNKVYGAQMSRYNSRFVGIQQTRTKTNNQADTVFTSKLGYAHDKLQFTQQGEWLALDRYSYYGKGPFDLRAYYSNIVMSQAIHQDTMSHDTVEAIGGNEHGRLHRRGFSVFNFEKSILEGQATNFPAMSYKAYTRWHFGTMQSMRELVQKGVSSSQKWITSLSIRGYWAEMLFFLYIMMGFIAVILNIVILHSTFIYSTLITLGLLFVSMYMIVVCSKFKELSLITGGVRRNFRASFSELIISTIIYLCNIWPGFTADLGAIDNLIQQKATGVPKTIPWLPSAQMEAMFKNPKLHTSFRQFTPQVKLGILMLSILLFTLIFIPQSPLVWSTVLVYLFWSFPIYFSFLFGWYFAAKSGQYRGAMTKAVNALNEGDELLDKKSSALDAEIGRQMAYVWGNELWDVIQNPVVIENGIYEKFGDDFKDLRDYGSSIDKDQARKDIIKKTEQDINKKIFFWLEVSGVIMIALGVIGILSAFLMMHTTVLPWILFCVVLVGCVFFLIGHFFKPAFVPEKLQKAPWPLIFIPIIFVLGASLVCLGIVGVLGVSWFSGIFGPLVAVFTIVIGLLLCLIAGKMIWNIKGKFIKYFYFRNGKVEKYREHLKEQLWKSRKKGMKFPEHIALVESMKDNNVID
ncbi:hypothetical protein KKC59_01830, partial [bacterium]|nr:hypothetical protein [bacterium]